MQRDWQQDYVVIHGIRFFYTRTGAGSGKPVIVLAHGFSDYGLNWTPLASQLESEYDLILPDARGHGHSQRVQPGEQTDLAGDLAEIIKALELPRPIVGGHSMGGYTAAAMAARYPGLARALILEDPAWFDQPAQPEPEPAEPKPNPWFEWLLDLPNQTIEQVIAKGRKDSPNWPEEEYLPWAESKKLLDPNFVRNPRMMPGDWRGTVRALTVPTLLLTAEKEKGAIISVEMAEEIRRLSPHVQVAYIPGAGHSIRRENGPAYIKAVKDFLSTIEK